ncbi:MAG: hypothetical protein IJJ85_03145 [Clostridia bacterium]|nr:hypothetical protein [Clostridia bacterium]
MKIIQGLSDGQVLQRGENGCDIRFTAEGKGRLHVSPGEITPLGDNRFRLTGIPVGGPYRLTLTDDENEAEVEDVYVGDVWLLAGQSNMEGAGVRREKDAAYDESPLPEVRAYYMDGRWDAAKSRLHQLWLLPDAHAGVREKHRAMNAGFLELYKEFTLDTASGVGPGLYIARRLYALTGVPQGLIPCGFGGASLWDWSPDNRTSASLYRCMLRRFADCGSHVGGVFWYQGESEAMCGESDTFLEKTKLFVTRLRADTGDPSLPFVQAQLGPCTLPQLANEASADSWRRVRVLQMQMPQQLNKTATVSTMDASLQDMIHLDAASQERLGGRMAEEMFRLRGGDTEEQPTVGDVTVYPHPINRGRSVIALTFDHVVGELTSVGQPRGFSVTLDDETPYLYPYRYLSEIRLEGNRALLTVEDGYVPKERACVWYGAGFSCVATVTDGAGRPLTAFGPVKITT